MSPRVALYEIEPPAITSCLCFKAPQPLLQILQGELVFACCQGVDGRNRLQIAGQEMQSAAVLMDVVVGWLSILKTELQTVLSSRESCPN